MGKVFARVGPGLMLAAAAVGVSHLVWSTRAGAEYGLSLVRVDHDYRRPQIPGVSICARLCQRYRQKPCDRVFEYQQYCACLARGWFFLR